MLQTQFPRLPGDIGNPESFDNPVIYKTVEGASPEKVVRDQSKALLSPFISAGKELIADGAELITTSCGFLIYFQEELQDALCVPVVTSSLLMFSKLEQKFGSGKVGILTISRTSLSSDILEKSLIPLNTPIGSTEGGKEFTAAILENRKVFDAELCEEDNVNAARELLEQFPHIKAILLECTNMPPHQSAIEKATGLEVYSIMDLLNSAA
jgi:aspartate/glutamate racemase